MACAYLPIAVEREWVTMNGFEPPKFQTKTWGLLVL